ncbi:hypothetical protein KRR40_35570 [Niabella defluvii]|nr:hypothetical protein KRR40_35570 [Niabella sp. I65]
MKTVIVKYNAGNIQSVLFALERIGMQAVVTDDKEAILSADKIIFQVSEKPAQQCIT